MRRRSFEPNPKRGSDHDWTRRTMRWLLALIYLVAGALHVVSPEPFLLITPDWVPYPRFVVFLTGLCEIAGSISLLTSPLRKLAGIMLALYAVCVFPANVHHAVHGVAVPSLPQSWWYHGPRLAFQPVLVWWALFCAGVIDWPFRTSSRARRPT